MRTLVAPKFFETVTVATVCLLSIPNSFATQKSNPIWQPKIIQAAYTRGVAGGASLTIQQKLELRDESNAIQFQNGKVVEDIEFYTTPRCYLHFKTTSSGKKNSLSSEGKILKISKIDNIYSKGSVHVTFWFDHDASISDLYCITNYDHTLTLSELKETLGDHFQMSFTKSVERDALFNTAPKKNAPTLTETSTTTHPLHSARLILSDS